MSSARQRKGPARVSLVAQSLPETIKPRNDNQGHYLEALRGFGTAVAIGPAGTGKTFMSASIGIDRLIADEVDKLVLTRPTIGVDEELGFLPGNPQEKVLPWLVPFTYTIEKRIGGQRMKGLIREGKIEICALGMMRGRTLDNAYVILDEAQNTTLGQIKMFLTRIGEKSLFVVQGDLDQSDLREKYNTGLHQIVRIIQGQSLPVPLIQFTDKDVVRSKECAMWAEAFRKDRP